MKRIITLSIAALFTLTISAQEKIAFVDNKRLFDAWQEKKDLEAILKKQADAHQAKRDSISRAFQVEVRKFDEEVKTLSENIRSTKYNKLMEKQQILQQYLQNEEYQLTQMSNKKLAELTTKLKEAIRQYGKENNYTFILGANEGGSVLYGKDNKDITDELIRYLNQQYKKN
ncbi:periplasmic chaperone for outer membrane proteins Skp [Capnocytophaga haemolytica]|jgi:outer membrane chaperone skp|uniref:Periplasmic chaperone n=1 Tax=Capnocytophaga haemolytica TaxID=45243 RepID=A0AAX2H1V6_9FLAO|nr:OmpH family outer membrane protein [Capnocytophaga haemolytica]AMD84336.1 hypothetical protein AXF12_01565 [Capnocytophaga haemolytica]SFO30569.1 periplasmic chaperone for outer membrane proteins Skp [Capnocytophaga haemolytica]SNV11672.1 periplasmic chaperone [Capnocytophaga haemolytica]